MGGKLAMVTGALVLALATTAQAEQFCVQRPGCEGIQHDTLQSALTAADATTDLDDIAVGPGPYDGPFAAAQPVRVSGVRDTVLRATGSDMTVLDLPAGSRAAGFTVEVGDGATVTGVEAPQISGVRVTGTATAATGLVGTQVTGVDVELTGTGSTGIVVPSGDAPTVDTTRIAAHTGIAALGGVRASEVVIALDGAPDGAGVRLEPAAGAPSSILRRLTIAGQVQGTGVELRALAPETVTAVVEDSVITGVPEPFRLCDGAPPGCAATDAAVTTSYSAYDPDAVTSGTVAAAAGTPPPVAADPRLDGDLRPRFDSPLIDAASGPADPAVPSDASGLRRGVDGDGDGDPLRDIGALEYQRRAPEITLSAGTPATAPAGTPVPFGATASDPDGEAVTASWAFSDGATAAGLDVTHAFAAPGDARATLVVTDPAGVRSSASVPVTVTAPPSGGEPGPAPRRPTVIARVVPERVRLRATARRDRKAPYRFKLRGAVVLPEGIAAAGCRGGVVRLAIRAGKRRLSRSARLAGDCSFRLTLRLGRKRAKRIVVTPRFAGTDALAPRAGAALRLRAG